MSSSELNLLESWELGHVYYLKKGSCNILWSIGSSLGSHRKDIFSGFRNGQVEWILEIMFIVRLHIVSMSKLLSCNVFRLTCSEFHFPRQCFVAHFVNFLGALRSSGYCGHAPFLCSDLFLNGKPISRYWLKYTGSNTSNSFCLILEEIFLFA
jgi:hypothetical protein